MAALATPDLIRRSGQRGNFLEVRAHSAPEDVRAETASQPPGLRGLVL